MRKFILAIHLFVFLLARILFAAEIFIDDAIKDNYEAEKYLLSEHLVTNLHFSDQEGKRPLILILGGSNPNFTHVPGDARIQSLLNRGYHVLEAEYFLSPKIEPLPDKLSQIRLESFWEQIEEYLKSEKTANRIDPNRIGVMGTSKGGELALLLASLYPQFKFVVAIVPSHVVFQASNTTLFHYSSWTYKGKEVPFVPFSNFSIATIWGVLTRIFCKPENVNFTWMHTQALTNKSAVDKAIINVENIQGPILLVSGLHDQWWPSAQMSQLITKRLEEKQFPHSYIHFECSTDHFPFRHKPEVWGAMIDQIDKMVGPRKVPITVIE